MESENKAALVALHSRRESVIKALTTHFAEDALDMDEFEQRLDMAHQATSLAELAVLLTDLQPAPVESATAVVPRSPTSDAVVTTGLRKRILSIMSNITRKGAWRVPQKLRVVSAMGAVELDFCEAILGPGVTVVQVRAVMGAVSITVPSNLHVECDGLSLMGNFEELENHPGELAPDAPLLRIKGVAVMGSLEISTEDVG